MVEVLPPSVLAVHRGDSPRRCPVRGQARAAGVRRNDATSCALVSARDVLSVAAMPETLRNYIGGHWIEASTTGRTLPVTNPATGELIARVPLSDKADVDRAVSVAQNAYESWREVPVVQRARYLFKFKELLERNAEELARIVTSEHGKTLDEARGSIRRGIENVEHACGTPALMMGESLEDVGAGIDCETI